MAGHITTFYNTLFVSYTLIRLAFPTAVLFMFPTTWRGPSIDLLILLSLRVFLMFELSPIVIFNDMEAAVLRLLQVFTDLKKVEIYWT